MQPKRIDTLQHMPVFGAIRDDTLDFLLQQANTVAVPRGERFFREGDPAQSMFVLEAGRAAVLKQWQGDEFLLHQMGVGDCFGEMALLGLFPRSASVRADEDCRAIELTSADLLRLFERDAEQFALVQMNIAREVCRRLRTTDELLFRAWMGERPAALKTVFVAT
jgi:CRP/FNR family transcriptional regulator, cyclic AMP receptor protein